MRSTRIALASALLALTAPSSAAAQVPEPVAAIPAAPLASPTLAATGDDGAAVRDGGLRAVPAAVSTAWVDPRLAVAPTAREHDLLLRNGTDAGVGLGAAIADRGLRGRRSGKQRAITGALVGAGAGALFGGFLNVACESGQGCHSVEHDVTAFALLGGAAGALAGWALGGVWNAIQH